MANVVHPDRLDEIRTLLHESKIVSSANNPSHLLESRRKVALKLLLDCLEKQIRFGCEDDSCTTPSCWSYHKSKTGAPVRRPTELTARDQAFVLASADNALRHLCSSPLRTTKDGDGRVDTEGVRAYIERLLYAKGPSEEQEHTHEEELPHVNGALPGDEARVPANGTANGALPPPPPLPAASQLAAMHAQTKIDNGNLAQKIFHTGTMQALFNFDLKLDPGPNTHFPVHETRGIDEALSLVQRHRGLYEAGAISREDGLKMYEYACRCLRYCMSNSKHLLTQYVSGDRKPSQLSALGQSVKYVVDTLGNPIHSITPLEAPLDRLLELRDLVVWKWMFDQMWHVLDEVLVPPKELVLASRNAYTQDLTFSEGFLDDTDAAQILFLAIRLLTLSITPTDAGTLGNVVTGRSYGDIFGRTFLEADLADNVNATQKRVSVMDSFAYEPAIRLAEKVVLALATRRAWWEALKEQRDGQPVAKGRETFAVMLLIKAHLVSQNPQPAPPVNDQPRYQYQYLYEQGLLPGAVLLEWLKVVFRKSWSGDGHYILNRWNGAGAALELMKDLYVSPELAKKNILYPGDFSFCALYKYLHAHKVIPSYLEWMELDRIPDGAKRHKNERHILEYPFLFRNDHRVFYFRLMLYHQMYISAQSARASRNLAGHWNWLLDPNTSSYRCGNPDCDHAMCDRLRLTTRQTTRWTEAGYPRNKRPESNFWDRGRWLRHKLQTVQNRFLILDIERQHVLQSAFDQLWFREHRELMKPLKVVMRMDGKDEDAADHGGVSQEFFRLVLSQAFDEEYGMFVVTDETSKMNWFRPLSPEPLQTFEMLGLLVGLAVYNNITLPVNFPRALYELMSGNDDENVHLDGWPALAKSFTQLRSWDEEEDGSVEDVFARDFAFSFEANGKTYTIDMLIEDPQTVAWPTHPGNAPPAHWTDDTRTFSPVTAANRLAFIYAYKSWLVIHSVQPQLSAFLKGFKNIIPRSFTTFLTGTLLQTTVEGSKHIDIKKLKQFTSYGGSSPPADGTQPTFSDEYSPAHPTVQSFWSVVETWDQTKLKKLLTFVTASERVPSAGYGSIGFSLERHGGIEGLPTSSTCFGKLFMPPYESKEHLEKMLTIAVEEGSSGFGFM